MFSKAMMPQLRKELAYDVTGGCSLLSAQPGAMVRTRDSLTSHSLHARDVVPSYPKFSSPIVTAWRL